MVVLVNKNKTNTNANGQRLFFHTIPDHYMVVERVYLQIEHAVKHAFFTAKLPWKILVLHTNQSEIRI